MEYKTKRKKKEGNEELKIWRKNEELDEERKEILNIGRNEKRKVTKK